MREPGEQVAAAVCGRVDRRWFAYSEPPAPPQPGRGSLSPVGGPGAGVCENRWCLIDPKPTPGSAGATALGCPGRGRLAGRRSCFH